MSKKKGVNYGKPDIKNKRRPKNAEEVVKEGSMRLSQVNDLIIGFLDEIFVQMNPNKRRIVDTERLLNTFKKAIV